ncbi:endonuclease/exonuclease/phosphatase family protein [Limihaloglobus sulfuriphilus]|uniref:endonuclease/exonuclease/phosphatase family protein n=1 Tax=Limihaloglobus sulfuriphilus TaxID=1851148 RepID=UPI00214F6951|nr:endonuclease/exonuclease/phosphatase family protein [Limihaloglobus sulfuriphilus]
MRVATYNIEHFMRMFDQQKMPERSRNMTELYSDEEDVYEVAAVIKSKDFNADIIAIQECCDEQMLELFVKKWLDGEYEYAKVSYGNTDGQYLGFLVRKGWSVRDFREYVDIKDPADDRSLRSFKEREGKDFFDFLFSRGPAFILVESPGGTSFWVGCTHVKSKYGNNEAVTKWRLREIDKTRQICAELLAGGKTDKLVILGDFNDTIGMDKYEKIVGADVVMRMTEGSGGEELKMLTRKLSDSGKASYHCEFKPRYYRGFLDHVFASPAMAECFESALMVESPVAAVASDHYPVVCEFEFE